MATSNVVTDNAKMSSYPKVGLVTDNEKMSSDPNGSLATNNQKRRSDPKANLMFHLDQEAVKKEDLDGLLEELCPDSYEEQTEVSLALLEVCMAQRETMLHYDSLTATERQKWLVQFTIWKLRNGLPPHMASPVSPTESPHTPQVTPRPTRPKHTPFAKMLCETPSKQTQFEAVVELGMTFAGV